MVKEREENIISSDSESEGYEANDQFGTVITIESDVSPQKSCVTIESDSEDEPPEDLSLKEGRERMREALKQQHDAQQTLKEKKKQQQKERDLKNKKQRDEKKSKNDDKSAQQQQATSLIPEKLSDRLLDLASVETDHDTKTEKYKRVKITKSGLNPKKKNKRIKFDDADDEADNDVDSQRSGGIQAKYIGTVSKNDISHNARQFLNEHFFGGRLKRRALPLVKTRSQRKRKRIPAKK